MPHPHSRHLLLPYFKGDAPAIHVMRVTDQSHGVAQSFNIHDQLFVENVMSVKQDRVSSDGGACLTCLVGKEEDEEYGKQKQIHSRTNAAIPLSSSHGPCQDFCEPKPEKLKSIIVP